MLHPVLFELFGLPISPYGLLIAVGMLVGVWLCKRRAEKAGLPGEAVLDMTFWGVIAGFLGARVMFIATNFGGFLKDPTFYLFSRSGFVFLGGLIAAVPTVWLVLRKWKVPFAQMADITVAPLALAHGFGRMGCFFAGCCYGKQTDSPLGVSFPRVIDWRSRAIPADELFIAPNGVVYKITEGTRLSDANVVGQVVGSPAFQDQVLNPACDVHWADSHALPVHPTQLYEAGLLLLLFATLWLAYRSRRFHGQVFLLYLWLYPPLRFVIEMFRGDPGRGEWLGVSTSQWIGIGMLAAALTLTLLRKRLFARVEITPAPAASPESGSSP